MAMLQYNGQEDVREVQRSDLGVHPDSDEVLIWDKSNNFICEVELDDEEVQALARGGGSWVIVGSISYVEPEQPEPIELPTVDVTLPAPVETQESAASGSPIQTQEGVDAESSSDETDL